MCAYALKTFDWRFVYVMTVPHSHFKSSGSELVDLQTMPRNSKPNGGSDADTAPSADALDVSGLAEEWDQCDDIRDRLRGGEGLIHNEAVLEDVRGCVLSSSLLVPILTRMSLKDSKPLPPITELRVEIEKLFVKNKRVSSPEQLEEVVKASWRVKKFCGFVKMKTRREEVSTVTRTKLGIFLHFSFKNPKPPKKQFNSSLHFLGLSFICFNVSTVLNDDTTQQSLAFGFEVDIFQNLCLILNPMLQVGRLYEGARTSIQIFPYDHLYLYSGFE